jgi:hypothetical protein
LGVRISRRFHWASTTFNLSMIFCMCLSVCPPGCSSLVITIPLLTSFTSQPNSAALCVSSPAQLSSPGEKRRRGHVMFPAEGRNRQPASRLIPNYSPILFPTRPTSHPPPPRAEFQDTIPRIPPTPTRRFLQRSLRPCISPSPAAAPLAASPGSSAPPAALAWRPPSGPRQAEKRFLTPFITPIEHIASGDGSPSPRRP